LNRIFFLKDGSNSFKEVAKLRDIDRVDKLQFHSLFMTAVDALVIPNKGFFTSS
jgi:hypothetical protein